MACHWDSRRHWDCGHIPNSLDLWHILNSSDLSYSKFFGSLTPSFFWRGLPKSSELGNENLGGGDLRKKKFSLDIRAETSVSSDLGVGILGGGDLMDHIKHPKNLRKNFFFPRIAPPKKSEPEIWTFFTPQNEFDHYKRPLNRREIWGKKFFSSDLRPKFFSSDLRPAPQNPNLRSGEFFTPQN